MNLSSEEEDIFDVDIGEIEAEDILQQTAGPQLAIGVIAPPSHHHEQTSCGLTQPSLSELGADIANCQVLGKLKRPGRDWKLIHDECRMA